MLFDSKLIELFLQVWQEKEGETIDDINLGWCYQFALILGQLFGASVNYCNNESHCWIELNGRFYDSDCPQGTENPKDISPWSWEYMDAAEVEEYWNINGNSGHVRWDVIDTVVYRYTQWLKKAA